MCLLIMIARSHPEASLIVGANRDELLERPAEPMAILQTEGPRILGGRDHLAGGTWFALNEAGVVAGLTNAPSGGQRDPDKRSRGELPLALAGFGSAAAAVDAFVSAFHPSEYNPAWLLVGDRESTFAIDMTRTSDDRPVVRSLPPGVHVLENRAAGTESPKVQLVRRLLEGVESLPIDAAVRRVKAVLADHQIPPDYLGPGAAELGEIPAAVKAACVHTERYGTRWSGVVTVPVEGPPAMQYADGPPCCTPYASVRRLWSTRPGEGGRPQP